jgi:hypothetical protein
MYMKNKQGSAAAFAVRVFSLAMMLQIAVV